MTINATSSNGVTLKTANTYVEEDIDVTIETQTKTVTGSYAAQTVTPDTGVAGLTAVTVNATPIPSYETVTAVAAGSNGFDVDYSTNGQTATIAMPVVGGDNVTVTADTTNKQIKVDVTSATKTTLAQVATNKTDIASLKTTVESNASAATSEYAKIRSEFAAADSTTLNSAKTYANDLVAKQAHFSAKVVTSTSEMTDSTVLYLVKDTSVTGADKYNEYLVIDGTPTMIGDTTTDLSNYYKKTEVDGLISTAKSDLTTAYKAADTSLQSTITTAYKAADDAVTAAYQKADSDITTAYKAADTSTLSSAKSYTDSSITSALGTSGSITTAYSSADTALKTTITSEYTAAISAAIGDAMAASY